MHLHSFHVRNFRRLKDVHIDLEEDVSIFVGANNSGKTSATQVFSYFVARGDDKLTLHDFSADCCRTFDRIGAGEGKGPTEPFPRISLDLWLQLEENDLQRVIDLIPSLSWDKNLVGLRIEFAPRDEAALWARYREARSKASAHAPKAGTYQPWPETLSDYLSKHLGSEFDFRYYVLDHTRFSSDFKEEAGYVPSLLASDTHRSGQQIIRDLIHIDFLNAQKHLSDSSPGGRAEDLSRRLSRFYVRNRDKGEIDHEALGVLFTVEEQLSGHLTKALDSIIKRLDGLGYPGLDNPQLKIKSAFRPEQMLGGAGGARVHYQLDNGDSELKALSLPDRYNGLGFKNLIYMVVELLDFQARWKAEEVRQPLHLIFIEEPEAHLHTQLQQVFIRQVSDIMKPEPLDEGIYRSQLVVTTHSPHILHERGFTPIRYFRRPSKAAARQMSEVLSLSWFYQAQKDHGADYLQRYLKLMHCDLFFADAAILVEGNVERLLMPLMIEKTKCKLESKYLCVLEIGGAFGYRFCPLMEFLGIPTLIITDLDSVFPRPQHSDAADDIGDDSEEEPPDQGRSRGGGACQTDEQGAVTSNQTLTRWLPGKEVIQELLDLPHAQKERTLNGGSSARVRVAYQTRSKVNWNSCSEMIAGRTLEETFALENLEWCQAKARQHLKLRINKSQNHSPKEIARKIHTRVNGDSFKKTDFALALMAEDRDSSWVVPSYIAEGLLWLAGQLGVAAPAPTSGQEEAAA
ncbi:AAA family ATPase [Corallococcus sp. ZKHCc1 1396]|uniref:AAA family ATPase n=1 Tax=Corallococcus soli TaxID=2710757 RepID=A0ABR9PZK9_9BACT|nr:ATP-dependent endonuclease [Corallococcus soli]MBE4753373.1 AAA family ATPase [Corallococcus soli]